MFRLSAYDGMKTFSRLSALALLASASVRAAEDPDLKKWQYRRSIAGANDKDPASRIYFFADDVVFPQVAIGGGWTTTFYFTNIGTRTETVQLDFWTSAGGLWQAPIGGRRADRFEVRVAAGQTVTLQSDSPATVETGWATILNDDASSANLVGNAVFRQRAAGRSDFEAGVSLTGAFDRRFVLQYDNTLGYVTGMAIAALEDASSTVTATIRGENGTTLGTRTFNLADFGHTSFVLVDRFPETANRRGSILFQSSRDGLSGMGLRFTPAGAFTSFPILTNSALQQ